MTPARHLIATELPDDILADFDEAALGRMRDAAVEVVRIVEALAAQGTNVVNELVRSRDAIVDWEHYPGGDAFDPASGAQYYYHSHDGSWEEHGHFHTFMRARGMPANAAPVPQMGGVQSPSWPKGEEAVAHLVAVGMNHRGLPTHLFTVNRWVTAEALYPAESILQMLDGFTVAERSPVPEIDRWLTALLAMFRPQIGHLVHARDAALEKHRASHEAAGTDLYEDRELEILSIAPISIESQLERLGLLD